MCAEHAWRVGLFAVDVEIYVLFLGDDVERCGVACATVRDAGPLVWKHIGLEERDRMAQTRDLLGRIDAGIPGKDADEIRRF